MALYFNEQEIAMGLAGGGENPDGDGFNNWCEYVAGTDPRNAGSVWRLGLSRSIDYTGTILSFDSVSGRVYSVYSRTNLLYGEWRQITNNLVGDGNVMNATALSNRSVEFFRVEVELP